MINGLHPFQTVPVCRIEIGYISIIVYKTGQIDLGSMQITIQLCNLCAHTDVNGMVSLISNDMNSIQTGVNHHEQHTGKKKNDVKNGINNNTMK